MKHLTAAATALVALATAGCSAGGSYRPVSRLDCPQSEGGLTRVNQAADGKSCGYVSDDGAEITLKLIPVSASVDATLKRVESDLRADLSAAAPAAADQTEDEAAAAKAAPSGSAAADAAAVRAQAEADARAVKAEADVSERSGGVDADWTDDGSRRGDHTRVDLPGVHIVADEGTDSAQVRVGPLHIDANDDGAVIRMQRDVRLKGEALSRRKNGVRATYILAGDEIGNGYAYAGYEAGGPRTGPLAVAVVKGREGGGDHEDVYNAVKKLVRRNGGV